MERKQTIYSVCSITKLNKEQTKNILFWGLCDLTEVHSIQQLTSESCPQAGVDFVIKLIKD